MSEGLVHLVKQRFGLVFTGLLIFALVCVGPGMALPGPCQDVITLNPGDPIANNISAVCTGGTLILNPGTYSQHDILVSNDVRIQANTSYNHGPSDTIIDADLAGRIFDNSAGHALTMDNLTLRNGNVGEGAIVVYGGAIYSNGGTITISSSTLTDCSASGGGAIGMWSGTLIITSTTITGCTATNGPGGALLIQDSSVFITSSTITGCTASDSGGAIYSYSSTIVTTSTTFSGCRAMAGGAIDAGSSTVTLGPGTRFTDCTASKFGGAIYTNSNIVINSATFSECMSGSGGAIYNQNGGTLTITGSTFTNIYGIATDGGAIYNDAGTVGITDSAFSGYRAQNGGAIFNEGGIVTIAGSAFTDCGAEYGGAIFTNGDLDISTSTFFGCSASGDGGAIASTRNHDITVRSSIFSDCWATGAGGAIRGLSGSTLTITSSSFTGCRAVSGSAIDFFHVTMHFCRIYDNGGNAVHASDGDVDFNWWGLNSGPAAGDLSGPAINSWLVLGITANPDTLTAGQTAYVPANLTWEIDTKGISTYHDPAAGHVPDDMLVLFMVTRGTGSVLPFAGGTESGTNTTAYTSASGTVAMVNATVDGESVGVWINVNGAAFTGSPTSGSAPLAVQFTDASVGTPAMWNWSFGDGQWFNTTDAAAASPLHTYPGTGTYTVSLTVTGAFGTHTLTRTGYIVVAPLTAPTAPVVTLDTSGNDDGFPTPKASPVPTGEGTLPPMTVTINIGGDSKAWQAIVTGTKLSELIVTGTVQPGPGSNLTAPPGIVYQFISLVPARYTSITHAVIFFTVPQSWLDENHIDPKSVVLYHMTANGGWEALPTTVVSTKDGTVYFSGQSTGFSLFAIAGMPADSVIVDLPRDSPERSIRTEEPPVPAAVATVPVTTQTTAPPAVTPQPAAPSPLLNIVLVIAAIGILAGGGFMARRWWIQRQNPVLFREYD